MTCEGKFCTLEASRLTWRAEREMAGSATEATLKATGILGNLSKMGTWKKDHRKPGEPEKKCELLQSGDQREFFLPYVRLTRDPYWGPIGFWEDRGSWGGCCAKKGRE